LQKANTQHATKYGEMGSAARISRKKKSAAALLKKSIAGVL